MAYLNSENIQMYPSAYREGSKSKDTFAQLNTEFNLTHTKLLSQYNENNNYSYEDNGYLIIYIQGYYFKILETAITSIQHNTNNNLYAAIQLADIQVADNIYTKVLVNYENVTQTTLDVLKSGSTTDYEFQGLYITDDSTGIGNYYIKIAEWKNNAWTIFEQPLKLSTTEIRDSISSDNSIAVDLTTQNLNTTNLNTTNLRVTNILDNTNIGQILIGNGAGNDEIVFWPNKGTTLQKVSLGDTIAPFENIFGKNIIANSSLDISGTLALKDSENKQILKNETISSSSNNHRVITIGDSSKDTTNTNAFIIRPFKTGNNQAVVNIGEYSNAINAIFVQTISAQTVTATSDIRLKENIKDYICEKSILDLPIKEFDFKESKQHTIGCIAQDLKEICPEIVHENEEGFLTIEENKLVYLLIQEVKKLKEEIEKLK